MWLLLRLGLRFLPFLAAGLAALVRRYRWPLYYGSLAYRPRRFHIPPLGRLLAGTLLALLALGIALYLIDGVLAPR